MRRWPFVLLALAVVLVGGRFIYGALNHPDDKVLIKQALTEAIQASKEGRAGGVVDKLAENFKVNDMETGMKQVATFIKNNHPEVVVNDIDPIVSGDTAQINSDVVVKVSFLNGAAVTFKDAQIQFKKESTTEWLIFPTERWRL
jgi:hypothetical protein